MNRNYMTNFVIINMYCQIVIAIDFPKNILRNMMDVTIVEHTSHYTITNYHNI